MSTILDQLRADLGKAVKEKNAEKASTLRFFLSGLYNEQIAKQKDLTDEEIVMLIRRQVKKHDESIEAFRKGGREDLVQKEENSKKILGGFLPAQLSDEEVRKLVSDIIATGANDFGRVMGQAIGKLKGRVDGAVVARIVKEELHG